VPIAAGAAGDVLAAESFNPWEDLRSRRPEESRLAIVAWRLLYFACRHGANEEKDDKDDQG
jgi:hypothetical protein